MLVLLIVCLAVGVLLGIIGGGSIHNFTVARLSHEALFLAFFVFLLAWPVVAELLGIGSVQFMIVWVLAALTLAGIALLNARHLGMLLIAAGLVANALVIGLNGGMPVVLDAEPGNVLEESRARLDDALLHIEYTDEVLLGFLADVVHVPGPRGLSSIVSLGDIFLCVGAGVTVWEMTRRSSELHSLTEAPTEDDT